MSPAAAAPSTASVTAWQTTSASEWPSSAALERNRDAAEDQRPALDEPMQIVAGADAQPGRVGRRPPTRRAQSLRPASRSSGVVILMFDASPSTRRTAMPGALGQRRFVGRVDARVAERERVAQHVAPERLRRLREEDRLARERLARRPPSGRRACRPAAGRFTVSRAGSAASAAPDSAAAAIVRAIRSRARRTAAPRRGSR